MKKASAIQFQRHGNLSAKLASKIAGTLRAARASTLIALGFTASLASALDIEAYSAQKLQAAQAANKPVALHFHADWCPTCRAQEKAFQQMKGDAALPLTLLVVDYDKERDLRKQLKVRAQSTVIVYRGNEEKARLGGETDPAKLESALASAL